MPPDDQLRRTGQTGLNSGVWMVLRLLFTNGVNDELFENISRLIHDSARIPSKNEKLLLRREELDCEQLKSLKKLCYNFRPMANDPSIASRGIAL
jgi:hypothetical protein